MLKHEAKKEWTYGSHSLSLTAKALLSQQSIIGTSHNLACGVSTS